MLKCEGKDDDRLGYGINLQVLRLRLKGHAPCGNIC